MCRACDSGIQRAWRLKHYFGLTVDAYDELLLRQNGVCAICLRPPTKIRLAVDHDHVTGAIRGLLCYSCNHLLGTVADDHERLARAAAYLKKDAKP